MTTLPTRKIPINLHVYNYTLTSVSNVQRVKGLCFHHLGKLKVSKAYKHIELILGSENLAVCEVCYTMNPQAAINSFGLTLEDVVNSVERSEPVLSANTPEFLLFLSDNFTLHAMRKSLKGMK